VWLGEGALYADWPSPKYQLGVYGLPSFVEPFELNEHVSAKQLYVRTAYG
jgi:hypothetical protein